MKRAMSTNTDVKKPVATAPKVEATAKGKGKGKDDCRLFWFLTLIDN